MTNQSHDQLCRRTVRATPERRADHAAYIAFWLTVLKEDKRAIFAAASHAQKAADYLTGLQPQPQPQAQAQEEDRQQVA